MSHTFLHYASVMHSHDNIGVPMNTEIQLKKYKYII